MADELTNLTVLVVEDDYYLAADMRGALLRAGASVAGPVASEHEALAAAEVQPLHCAVIDINLGEGPTFAAARALVARGVPVVFVSGYGEEVLPDDLKGLACLIKPAAERRIVTAVAAARAGAVLSNDGTLA